MRLVTLTLLFGMTWMTGFLLYSEILVVAYIFTIASGLQGVAIFFTCCLSNEEIRKALKKNLQSFNNYLVYKNLSVIQFIHNNTFHSYRLENCDTGQVKQATK